MEVDARYSVGSGVTDASTRTNQAEPRTVAAIYKDESFRGSEAKSLTDGGLRVSERKRGKLIRGIRVEVDACYSVGIGVTDASTRTHGTKPRTGEAIYEDATSRGSEDLSCIEGDSRGS